MIATASVGYIIVNKTHGEDEQVFPDPYDFGYQARLEFSMFTTSVGMIFVMIVLLLHVTKLGDKLSGTLAVSISD